MSICNDGDDSDSWEEGLSYWFDIDDGDDEGDNVDAVVNDDGDDILFSKYELRVLLFTTTIIECSIDLDGRLVFDLKEVTTGFLSFWSHQKLKLGWMMNEENEGRLQRWWWNETFHKCIFKILFNTFFFNTILLGKVIQKY